MAARNGGFRSSGLAFGAPIVFCLALYWRRVQPPNQGIVGEGEAPLNVARRRPHKRSQTPLGPDGVRIPSGFFCEPRGRRNVAAGHASLGEAKWIFCSRAWILCAHWRHNRPTPIAIFWPSDPLRSICKAQEHRCKNLAAQSIGRLRFQRPILVFGPPCRSLSAHFDRMKTEW
jgi:hypothetical protein